MTAFADLGLSEAVLAALDAVGYETPTPIQSATIPPLLEGRDVLGQAQTGTGKTAAFALPALSKIKAERRPQVLVLTPTRELAIQVAEAFKKYAAKIVGFHVLPVYGGQAYGLQLGALKRGVHVVVGTPGRLIDHMERGTLDLSHLTTLVIDEADEMLRMGFIDDVERILQKTPETRQTALFSATMPPAIRRIAQTYLKSPTEVTIRASTSTAKNIRQRYWLVSGTNKLDALTRILEAEPFEGILIFVRTKAATVELAERLQARGFEASPLNGDMDQRARERVVARLKAGGLDIVIATDVAARGLDVDRISHVVNYDIPTDAESYIHRIGRTGRAGRSGEAILFVSPRERHLLRAIERATRQPVEQMGLPTIAAVNDQRIARFRERIDEALQLPDLAVFRELIEGYEREKNVPAIEIAAALARLGHGKTSFLLEGVDQPMIAAQEDRPQRRSRDNDAGDDEESRRRTRQDDENMDTFRLEVGEVHGARPANIVGAIANELGMRSQFIGKIFIGEAHTLIDLPAGMPEHVFRKLQRIRVAGQELRASIVDDHRSRPSKRTHEARDTGDEQLPREARPTDVESQPDTRPARVERKQDDTQAPRVERKQDDTQAPRVERKQDDTRPPRVERTQNDTRPPRGERTQNDTRPPRVERTQNDMRPPRVERTQNDTRPPRVERTQNDTRPPRVERTQNDTRPRVERTHADSRGRRDDKWSPRAERAHADSRASSPRSERPQRDDRPRRSDVSPRGAPSRAAPSRGPHPRGGKAIRKKR